MKADVTMVLMTCGELSEGDCLKAIAPFRDRIEFFEVRNVYPQIVALNQMVTGVKTKYFVPLDADVVLNSNAWERISGALEKHRGNPAWHSILFKLWDTLTERKILALKLMRTDVAQKHLFKDSATPDVEHYERLTKLGYTCIHEYLNEPVVGEHRVMGKHFCYFKYRDVYQTYRAHDFEWDSGAFFGGNDLKSRAKAHFDFFIHKWATTDNIDYLHCIAGMMDGIRSPLENKSKTLEHREYLISTEGAVHQFFKWYFEPDFTKPEGMVF